MVPVPAGLDDLPEVGVCLAPSPRLDGYAGIAVLHGTVVVSPCLRRPVTLSHVVTVKPAIELDHNKVCAHSSRLTSEGADLRRSEPLHPIENYLAVVVGGAAGAPALRGLQALAIGVNAGVRRVRAARDSSLLEL